MGENVCLPAVGEYFFSTNMTKIMEKLANYCHPQNKIFAIVFSLIRTNAISLLYIIQCKQLIQQCVSTNEIYGKLHSKHFYK